MATAVRAQKWVEYCCVVTYTGAAFFYSNEKAFLDNLPPLASINGADVRTTTVALLAGAPCAWCH